MKKLKNFVFFVILLSLFLLAGCTSNEKIEETSTQINFEEQISNSNNEESSESNKELEYVQVVLNSGWEEELRKEKIINNLSQIANNSTKRDEEVQTENDVQEQNSDVSTDERDEETTEAVDYPYYIKINYQANVVNIYTKDENGEYTVPYKAMLCSTGTATPRSGVYSIIYKYGWLEMLGGVYAKYCCQVVGNILMHSVPYSRLYDSGSLQYWSYDKLGQSVSAGCIRLTVVNAKWIFDNCPNGTPVEFYASSDPGPLGKPEEMKISSYTEYRGWDPTDPDSNNPWNNYFQQNTGTIVEE